MKGCEAVKTVRMPEDPDELVDAIAVAVQAGDDRCIGVLLDQLKEVAGLAHLIRLHHRLLEASGPRGVTGTGASVAGAPSGKRGDCSDGTQMALHSSGDAWRRRAMSS
ncbi:hypothetical protein GCM10010425_76090 [Streptomyces spororaveus]|uniref:Transposase n=1 Tax=Streptomyces spororaveus TaxID=284039 RepID=A0ABQ3T3L9_9ACTN|nr:hypothetical protein Sspor_05110 [Streptomyces spororaveus]